MFVHVRLVYSSLMGKIYTSRSTATASLGTPLVAIQSMSLTRRGRGATVIELACACRYWVFNTLTNAPSLVIALGEIAK